jgi:hypothetical protein
VGEDLLAQGFPQEGNLEWSLKSEKQTNKQKNRVWSLLVRRKGRAKGLTREHS